MEQMPKTVPFWNFHVLIRASNISNLCVYYQALLIIADVPSYLGDIAQDGERANK